MSPPTSPHYYHLIYGMIRTVNIFNLFPCGHPSPRSNFGYGINKFKSCHVHQLWLNFFSFIVKIFFSFNILPIKTTRTTIYVIKGDYNHYLLLFNMCNTSFINVILRFRVHFIVWNGHITLWYIWMTLSHLHIFALFYITALFWLYFSTFPNSSLTISTLGYSNDIFRHLKMWIATAIHNLKWLKITWICKIKSELLKTFFRSKITRV